VQRQVSKSGNSLAIRLPSVVVDALSLKEGRRSISMSPVRVRWRWHASLRMTNCWLGCENSGVGTSLAAIGERRAVNALWHGSQDRAATVKGACLDAHWLRVLLAIAWYLVAVALYSRSGLIAHSATAFIEFTSIPAGCIYFLYHPVVEIALRGRTPGKRTAGVRIVTAQGGTPSSGALLLRNVFRLIDSLPVLYVVGLACCLVTERRIRIGDMAAGTLLVRESAAPAKALNSLSELVARSGLAPEIAELIDDLLKRWHALDVGARDALARTILTRIDSAAPAAAAQPGATPEVAGLNDSELYQRLRALLAGAHA